MFEDLVLLKAPKTLRVHQAGMGYSDALKPMDAILGSFLNLPDIEKSTSFLELENHAPTEERSGQCPLQPM